MFEKQRSSTKILNIGLSPGVFAMSSSLIQFCRSFWLRETCNWLKICEFLTYTWPNSPWPCSKIKVNVSKCFTNSMTVENYSFDIVKIVDLSQNLVTCMFLMVNFFNRKTSKESTQNNLRQPWHKIARMKMWNFDVKIQDSWFLYSDYPRKIVPTLMRHRVIKT